MLDMTDLERGIPVKERTPLSRVKDAMARNMKASVETLALSQVSRELDLTGLQAAREQREPRLSLNVALMAAVARALAAHPDLNAELLGDQIVTYAAVNLGMAVATPAGLIVVVIPGADQLPLDALAAKIDDLAGRARVGRITLADVEGGTFTVSNLGMLGIDFGIPIPRPPESAILMLGTARPRPVALEGQVVVRQTCFATLSFDHRFIDGAQAAAFMTTLNELVSEQPDWISR